MTQHITHPTWDDLNELADGVMSDMSRVIVERHVATCTHCRTELQAIRGLVDRLHHAGDVAAPAGLWNDVAARISHAPMRATSGNIRTWSMRPRTLAAAALLLVSVSVGTTYLLTRPEAMLLPASGVPVLLTSTDQAFINTVEKLEAQLAQQRAALKPETVAMVERSIATIDLALAEAREALLADPANTALREVLESTYRAKVDFLTRATQIAQGD